MSQIHVKLMRVGELISMSLAGAHKLGKTITFDLMKSCVSGNKIDYVRTIRGPMPDGTLLLEFKGGSKNRLKFEMDVAPSLNSFSVLMYNVGPPKEVTIAGLKFPLSLSGPALIFMGPNVFCYDGHRVTATLHGYLVENNPLQCFLVGQNVMLQNNNRRKSIKLPSCISEKDVMLVLYVNIKNVESGEANERMKEMNEVISAVPASNL